MPLNTQIIRDGKPLPIEGGWSAWHLNRMADAIEDEIPTDKFIDDMKVDWFPYGYIFKHDHVFEDVEENIWRGNITRGKKYCLKIKAGDVYNCWR